MKRLLNTLYISTQDTYLRKEGETVCVRVEKQSKCKIPIHTLDSIVCFGRVSCSPQLMGFCAEKNVTVSFCSEYGKFLYRAEGPVSGNVLLRRQQFRWADSATKCLKISANILTSKLVNSRNVLMRAARETADSDISDKIKNAADRLRRVLKSISNQPNTDSLRGVEGEAARSYFSVFDLMILQNRKDFYFKGRNKRPPTDNVNAMLSFFYTILAHDIRSALEGVGLDPAVGFLHCDRPGRSSLALDILEELRAVMVDRLVLSLINRKQVQPDGFKTSSSGAVTMLSDTKKILLVAYQKKKQEKLLHPFLKEEVSYGLLPHVQSLLLSRYIRGDLEGYPPFFAR